ncbi:MAG: MFS transporter [Micropruina sp.]|uniref:MFS transporter n=1 Tax=Micropruina sp. TaxID=2737536 RepID=UPI0039E413DD
MKTTTTLPLYLTATATSLFGNSAISIVLPWLVLERTGDPAMAGTVAAASALPGAIAAFAGGHLIDKIGRRRMSVLSDIGSALAVAALAVVDATLGLDVTWFIVLGVLGALFDVPGMTARETLLANVSQTSGVALDKVASLRGMLFGLSFLAGPALAGWLLALLPAITVVWLTAACSALAALAIAVMPLLPSDAAPGEDNSPLAGFTHIRRSPPLLIMLVVSLGSMVLVAPLLSVVLPAHFVALAAPGLLGLTLSAYAVGTMAGSGIYGWAFAGRRWAAWVAANLLYVVSAVLIATLDGFWLIAAGMVAAGLGSGLLQPISTVVLTEHVPDALRGRVFGAYSALAMVASPLGLGLMAMVLAGADLRFGAWMLAAGWVAVGVYALVVPGLRGYIQPRQEDAHADHRPAG